METKKTFIKRILKILIVLGPGIFCVGYTIGTGSIVSMAIAGSTYGLSLLWALVLACVFSFVMLEAYGRYTIVTGETALFAYKKRFAFGSTIAIITLVALVIAELMALIGIVGVLSDLLSEWTKLVFNLETGWNSVLVAVCIILVSYFLIWSGKYTIFEKILIVFVTMMTLSFIVSMFLVIPSPKELVKGIIPTLPADLSGILLLSALVGTTLTAPTFIMRSILVKEKGWDKKNLKVQTLDAAIAAFFMFLISGSVMACAAGTLYVKSQPVETVIQMVQLLEPLAGRFAISVFVLGILGAAMSSILPIAMLAPVLIGDYRGKLLNMKSNLFRILAGVAVLCGLIVPLTGANPVWSMILSQVFQIFPVTLVSMAIMYLLNRKDIMGEYKAGLLLNIGLIATVVFSFLISYAAIHGLAELIEKYF
jgi:Mn2+/Fe2+ NRAMP family transporter